MTTKPTFFISSTIHDFKDLRSAIKFYLEEQGCAVLASEFNDFGQPLDVHSYDACLAQIESADYFVLLIGARIGGWFDEGSKTSITRKEFRVAYDLHLRGRLKILTFVRADVWAVKDDRKELSRFLDGLGLDPATVATIKSRPGRAASDAAVLIDFIEEVGRNQQTNSAVKGKEDLPTGNWIHSFNSFRDVIDVLRGQVFAGRPAEHAVQLQLLRTELLVLISKLLIKLSDGTVVFPFKRIEKFSQNYPVVAESLERSITVARDDFERFVHVLFHVSGGQLHLQVTEKILLSDVLLRFDPDAGVFQETPIYVALVMLRQEIQTYLRSQSKSNPSTEAIQAINRAGKGRPVTLPLMTFVSLRHVVDRAANIVLLAKAAVRHLDGAPFEMPLLLPASPFSDQVEQLDKERVTLDLAEQFVAS
jgi:hypothetical protein